MAGNFSEGHLILNLMGIFTLGQIIISIEKFMSIMIELEIYCFFSGS